MVPNKIRSRFRDDDHALTAWNDGVSLVERGEYASAVAVFVRLAEQHYEGAAEVLARIYETGGHGVEIDLAEAKAWYEVAVRDEASASGRLGLARVLLLSDLPSDHQIAIALLEEANAEGDVHASLTLATLLEAGHRLPKDIDRAMALYRSAAARGYVYATTRLAVIASQRNERVEAIKLRAKAAIEAMKIAKRDPNDDRLWQL